MIKFQPNQFKEQYEVQNKKQFQDQSYNQQSVCKNLQLLEISISCPHINEYLYNMTYASQSYNNNNLLVCIDHYQNNKLHKYKQNNQKDKLKTYQSFIPFIKKKNQQMLLCQQCLKFHSKCKFTSLNNIIQKIKSKHIHFDSINKNQKLKKKQKSFQNIYNIIKSFIEKINQNIDQLSKLRNSLQIIKANYGLSQNQYIFLNQLRKNHANQISYNLISSVYQNLNSPTSNVLNEKNLLRFYQNWTKAKKQMNQKINDLNYLTIQGYTVQLSQYIQKNKIDQLLAYSTNKKFKRDFIKQVIDHGFEKIKIIDTRQCELKQIPIFYAYCSSLNYLTLDDNQIKKIQHLQHLKHITNITIKRNKLQQLIGIPKNNKLIQLNLQDNKIKRISNLLCKNLVSLNLSHNFISHMTKLDSLISLTDLDLGHNQIKVLEGVQSLKLLKYLNLQSNQICKIGDLRSMKQLQNLNLKQNDLNRENISLLSIKSCCNLKKLNLFKLKKYNPTGQVCPQIMNIFSFLCANNCQIIYSNKYGMEKKFVLNWRQLGNIPYL